MRADLGFERPLEESEFFALQTSANRGLETQFHYARALTWFAVLLRALLAREWAASIIIGLGAVTTLLPAFSDRLPQQTYLRWRLPMQIFDNILQVALGCYTHSHIYPNPSGAPSTFQMSTALLTGNGVAWLLFCSLWGSLPFRYALPQQAALTIILLQFSRPLCATNAPIQYAYASLARQLPAPQKLLQALAGLLRPSAHPRTCAAAVLAAPAWATEAVRAACTHAAAMSASSVASGATAQLLGATPASVAAATVARGAELCSSYQPASLLLLGFVFPTYIIWRTEIRLRRRFLATKLNPPPAGHPCFMDYLGFAVPAVACMYSYCVAAG